MILDLGFGHVLNTFQINKGIDQSCRWMDFEPNSILSLDSVPSLDSTWIRQVTSPSDSRARGVLGLLYPLSSDQSFLVVDQVRPEGLDLVCYIKLWGSLVDFFYKNKGYQLDSEFEPLVLLSPTNAYLGCRVSKTLRPPLRVDRFEISDWSVQSLECLLEHGDRSYLLKDLCQVQQDIEMLLKIMRGNKKYNDTVFIKADSPIEFIKDLALQNQFLGFHFDPTLTHEELNYSTYFNIFSADQMASGSKNLGYTIVHPSLRYRNHSWPL